MSGSGLPLPAGALRLAGRTALILGAGSVGPGLGIGKATALLFARHGARLCCVDRDEAALAETLRLVGEDGGQATGVAGDVTDEAALGTILSHCVAALGEPDILVNNVGGSVPGGPCEIAPADWDRQFAQNLRYAYLSMRLVLPSMERRGGGAIVNIASIAALRYLGRPAAAYAASKAALLQLSRQVAAQYAAHGIRCNCVVPGLILTPLIAHRLAYQAPDGDIGALMAERHARPPMERMGDAWDIASAALYLASDEARYVTGTEIVVDGGLTLTMR